MVVGSSHFKSVCSCYYINAVTVQQITTVPARYYSAREKTCSFETTSRKNLNIFECSNNFKVPSNKMIAEQNVSTNAVQNQVINHTCHMKLIRRMRKYGGELITKYIECRSWSNGPDVILHIHVTPSVLFYMTPLIFFFNFDQYYLINQLVKWCEMSIFTSIIKSLLNLT